LVSISGTILSPFFTASQPFFHFRLKQDSHGVLFDAALREALAALPNVRGSFHRKTPPLPTDVLARYKVGDTFVEPFFISTRWDKNLP
jgi:hypothetical protein